MAENRARQYGGVYARHGAKVRLARIVGGANDGCMTVLRAFPNFAAAAKSFTAVMADPAHAALQHEREMNPAADVLMPRQVVRVAYGELKWETHPFSFMRVYHIGRDNLPEAMKMLPEVTDLVGAADVNVLCAIPVVGDNMSGMTVSYQFRSVEHWGETLDTVGTSEAFQALLARAGKLGSVQSAFGMAPF